MPPSGQSAQGSVNTPQLEARHTTAFQMPGGPGTLFLVITYVGKSRF